MGVGHTASDYKVKVLVAIGPFGGGGRCIIRRSTGGLNDGVPSSKEGSSAPITISSYYSEYFLFVAWVTSITDRRPHRGCMRTRGLSAKYKMFEGASSTRRLGSGRVLLVGASLSSSVVGCRLGCLKQSELCLGHPIGDGMHHDTAQLFIVSSALVLPVENVVASAIR